LIRAATFAALDQIVIEGFGVSIGGIGNFVTIYQIIDDPENLSIVVTWPVKDITRITERMLVIKNAWV